MPTRLEPRVGDRPAGAVSDAGGATLVLRRAAGDLGCSRLRGLDGCVFSGRSLRMSLAEGMLGTEVALVRI